MQFRRLKLRLLPLALVAALALPAAFAAVSAEQAPQAAASAAQPAHHPLLWKVSDADNSVYLLGSFHLLKQEDYPLPKEIDAAFDDVESLLFEVDPREMTAPETMATIQKYAAYDAGKSLSTVLPKPTLDKLGNLLSLTGGSVQALEQKVEDAGKEFQCIKTTLLASMQGYAPQVAIEFGRKVLFSGDRPSFTELEGHVKKK